MRLIILLSFFLLFIPSALAADISLISDNVVMEEHIVEYPILLDNHQGIFRLTTYRIVPKNKNIIYDHSEPVKQFEIIYNDTIVYKKNFILNDNFLAITYDEKNKNYYFVPAVWHLLDFKIINGIKADYFAYALDWGGEDKPPYEYYVVKIIKNNYNSIELAGEIYSNKKEFQNPKINEYTYELVDDKYIITESLDALFQITNYYECIDDEIKFKDAEFKAIPREINKITSENIVTLYAKPNLQSNYENINLKLNTKVKFLGIKYLTTSTKPTENPDESSYVIHVMIGGQEGWIKDIDYEALGLHFIDMSSGHL